MSPKFESKWEFEGFMEAEMEFIARKHGGTVLFDYDANTMSFNCALDREAELVADVTEAMHKLGLTDA